MTQTKQERASVNIEQTTEPSSTKVQARVTVSQSIVIGSVAGATEVFVDHPLWSIKTRMQRGDPFTFDH